MGYNVNGSVDVTITEEVQVTLALRLGELAQDVGVAGLVSDGHPLVVAALIAAGFDGVEEQADAEGRPVTSGWYNGKLHDEVDHLLAWLAAAGAGVEATFSGEDDYRWTLRSTLGGSTIAEESLVDVPSSELAALTRAQQVLGAALDAVRHAPQGKTWDVAELEALLDPQAA
jgi:hypothetical protein